MQIGITLGITCRVLKQECSIYRAFSPLYDALPGHHLHIQQHPLKSTKPTNHVGFLLSGVRVRPLKCVDSRV